MLVGGLKRKFLDEVRKEMAEGGAIFKNILAGAERKFWDDFYMIRGVFLL